MAAVLEKVLKVELTVSHVINWLKLRPQTEGESNCQLDEFVNIRAEFVPFLLNYLRDKTLHLLQNSRATTPSPAKTPAASKTNARLSGLKCRGQLFSPHGARLGESPGGVLDTSLNSPNIWREQNGAAFKENIDSRHTRRSNDNKHVDHWKTPDSCKSKGKLSLGDFIFESGGDNRKAAKTPVSNPGPQRNASTLDNVSKPTRQSTRFSKSKPTGKIQKNLGQVFSISDSGDFPSLSTGASGDAKPIITRPSRRISPTPVSCDSGRHHIQVSSQLPQVPEQAPVKALWSTHADVSTNQVSLCLEQERQLLREEKAKIQGLVSNIKTLTPLNTPRKAGIERGFSVGEVMQASLSEVTHHEQVELLAELYSACLEEKLLPNLNVEIYFLVQLITSRGADPNFTEDLATLEDADDFNYLGTVHNVVHFSVIVLERHCSLVSMLDKGTLRLLSENQRVCDFSPTLSQRFTRAYDSSTTKAISTTFSSPIASVSFQADTDNKKNFPTEHAFHIFKKQRDMFYELIREWETQHMSAGWSMQDKMRERILHLLHYKTDLCNYVHFARLFQSQLIAMCKSDGQLKTEGDEEKITLLMQLKRSNPDKFKRLQERFVTPFSTDTPCPTPNFPGCEEFFHDFITVASSHVFNQHLIDSFTSHILQLNQLQLADVGVDIDRQTRGIDQEDRGRFTLTLLSLRLLGKFAGYVMFLPYLSREKICDPVVPSCLSLRSRMSLPLDLYTILNEAWGSARLSLTLPWIVQLLSMMDGMAHLLPHINRVLALLVSIYRHVSQDMTTHTTYHHLLITFTLGWLFELPSFSEGMFFQAITEPLEAPSSVSSGLENLDKQSLVDQQVLYTCCPYIGEVRCLLLEFATGSQGRGSAIRKITPISADVQSPNVTEQQLQSELEESFFHNHPASLRRVVEFTADRTASNYIKRFRNGRLVATLSGGRERVARLVQKIAESSPCHSAKDRAQKRVHDIVQELQNETRDHAAATCAEFCRETCDKVIPMLLPEEQTPSVVAMAAGLCSKQAEEKVNQWMSKHISHQMLHGELTTELHKHWKAVLLGKVVQTEPPVYTPDTTCTPAQHQSDTTPPTDLLGQLKACAERLVSGESCVDVGEIRELLHQTETCVMTRQDVLATVTALFQQLTIDITLLSISYYPDTWTPALNDQFSQLWSRMAPSSLHHHTSLMSQRLVHWLQRSPNPPRSWLLLHDLLDTCLIRALVTKLDLLQVIQQVLASPWTQETSERLHTLRDTLTRASHGLAATSTHILAAANSPTSKHPPTTRPQVAADVMDGVGGVELKQDIPLEQLSTHGGLNVVECKLPGTGLNVLDDVTNLDLSTLTLQTSTQTV